MSEQEFDILIKGLEKAEYNTLRLKAMRNETVIHSDENGKVVYVPARDVFRQLYNEPIPVY